MMKNLTIIITCATSLNTLSMQMQQQQRKQKVQRITTTEIEPELPCSDTQPCADTQSCTDTLPIELPQPIEVPIQQIDTIEEHTCYFVHKPCKYCNCSGCYRRCLLCPNDFFCNTCGEKK